MMNEKIMTRAPFIACVLLPSIFFTGLIVAFVWLYVPDRFMGVLACVLIAERLFRWFLSIHYTAIEKTLQEIGLPKEKH